MKLLLLKPGFLPKEYVLGRRASYLNPVKKYVFTSAIFFLLFLGLFKPASMVLGLDEPVSPAERVKLIAKTKKKLQANPADSLSATLLQVLTDSAQPVKQVDLLRFTDEYDFIKVSERRYRSLREYDSVQQQLPAADRDGWMIRMIEKKNIQLKTKYRNDPRSGTTKMTDIFLHKLPYMLFVSLPFFALILKLLYIRRKSFFYMDHGIFSIYHYIFSFLLLLAILLAEKIQDFTGGWLSDLCQALLFVYGGLYLYLSMKNFYGQGHGKTLMKFLLLNAAGLLMLIFLFLVFVLLSVFEA